jgi:hypothetical protein
VPAAKPTTPFLSISPPNFIIFPSTTLILLFNIISSASAILASGRLEHLSCRSRLKIKEASEFRCVDRLPRRVWRCVVMNSSDERMDELELEEESVPRCLCPNILLVSVCSSSSEWCEMDAFRYDVYVF